VTFGFRQGERVLVSITDPVPFISLTVMRDHLKLDPNDLSDQTKVASCTAAAVAAVEVFTQRLLSPRDIVVRLASLPAGRCPVVLAGGIVTAVTSVEISGEEFTGCEAIGSSPAVLLPPSDWPTLDPVGYPVEIAYSAGYATPPADLVVAVKMICTLIFDQSVGSGLTLIDGFPASAHSIMLANRIAPA